MKRLFNIISKKSTTALILFLFEILISCYIVLNLGKHFLIFGILIYLFDIIIIFFVANNKVNPAYKIAWIFSVILLPFVGGILYLTFGKRQIVKKFKRKFVDAKYFNYSFFENLIKDLENAKKVIFLELFIISPGKMWGEIMNILIEKVKNGVEVRLIYDDFGTIASLPKDYEKYLNKIGIKCMVFNPIKPRFEAIMNNRDHRKMVVIDGEIAYTGGINFADEYINEIERFGFWQDCGVRLKGDAVFSFVILFLNMWNYLSGELVDFKNFVSNKTDEKEDGVVLPFGDNPVNSYYLNDSIYLKIVTIAKKYVYIQTPYLIIDEKLTNSLMFAAQSGVKVVIITPNIYDKFYVHALTRNSYERLIKAGVEIYEFTPGFIHSKVIIADGVVGVLWTANFDFRSLYLHFECSVWMYKTKALKQIYEDFNVIVSKSKKVSLKECEKRSFFEKFLAFILKPFSSFLWI